jgi:hypothetical protein
VLLACSAQTPVPFLLLNALCWLQAPLSRDNTMHGTKLVKRRLRHQQLDEQLRLADRKLKFHQAVGMRLYDSHKLEVGIEVGCIAHGLTGVTSTTSQVTCQGWGDADKYRDLKGKPLVLANEIHHFNAIYLVLHLEFDAKQQANYAFEAMKSIKFHQMINFIASSRVYHFTWLFLA